MRILVTHFLIDELVDFFEWPPIHVLWKWLELPRQQRTVFDLNFRTRMKSVLSHHLNVTALMLVLRFLRVLDDLNLLWLT